MGNQKRELLKKPHKNCGRPSKEFISKYGYLPKKLRPKYLVYKNTICYNKYREDWKDTISYEIEQKFNAYKMLLNSERPNMKFTDVGLFNLYQAFRLWSLTNNGIFLVEKLLKYKKENKKILINVKWLGFEETTWEPLDNLKKYVPKLVNELLNN